MAKVYLSLGSNLGNKEQQMQQAIEKIKKYCGEIVAQSSFYTTEPWNMQTKNLFLNAAVELATNLTPFSLLLKLQDIEKEMGRINKTKNQEYEDRIIDIDILMYDDLKIDTFELSLPHPSMWERPFVLKPLVEIYPDILNQKPMTNMK